MGNLKIRKILKRLQQIIK